MNYDLFIPASAIGGPAVSGAQSYGGGQSTAAVAARRSPFDDQTAPRPTLGSASEQLSTDEVRNTVAAFNEVFEQANISVRYSFDEKTDDLVITLVNRETEEVLRQIPPEQILKMRQRLEELMGILFDSTA